MQILVMLLSLALVVESIRLQERPPALALGEANASSGVASFADLEAALCGKKGIGAARQNPAICDTLRKFRVCGSCADGPLARLGEPNDGGYLVCPSRALAGGISLGINGFDGFGSALSLKYGVPVQQYDCFNTKVPAKAAGADCQFSALCVADKPGQNPQRFLPLSTFVERAPAGDLLLKMDVEGAEWGALASASPATLARFEQIALEVHFLADTRRYHQFDTVMDKLLQDFVVVHNHGNNCCGSVRLGEYTIPKVFELTMVRRSAVQTSPCVSTRLNAQDAKNVMLKPHPVPVDLPANATFVQV